MSRFCDPRYLRPALIGALAASLAFGLAACGRKGPLDPPPGTALNGEQNTVNGQPIMGTNGSPRAPKGPDKHIPLDNLLN